MLQNRVDPFGRIITTPARGSWTGNRGVLHNEHKRIVAHYKTQAWIICRLEFKGRKREVMTPGRWTELFFLDEATALAAGHRPCFECRREDAKRFKEAWINGNPTFEFSMKTPIREIDSVIHGERIHNRYSKTRHQVISGVIPDGSFIVMNAHAYLVRSGKAHCWSPFGYSEGITLNGDRHVEVLTPKSIMNALRAGYLPQMNLDNCHSDHHEATSL